MTSAYSPTRRRWSDTFISEVCAILGRHTFKVTTEREDFEHATDLISFHTNASTRVAVRMRTCNYLLRYGHEITFRSALDSGNRTELDKILSGWGDIYFYGIAQDDNSQRIARWTLGDLRVFREWYTKLVTRWSSVPGIKCSNRGPSDSQFLAFRLPGHEGHPHEVLPHDFVIASGVG